MGILDNLSVRNPWADLVEGRPPYVVPEDLPVVARHNTRFPDDDDGHLHLDAYPEPYLGDPDAPILLLNRNPGHKPWDARDHANPELSRVVMDNLLHRPAEYPFYPVSPTYARLHHSDWWRRVLSHWIATYGSARVSRAFFCIEYTPYHSKRHRHLPTFLPSQTYSFALAAAKIRAGCSVIVMRAESDWCFGLGGLLNRNYERVNSWRARSLAPPTAGRNGNISHAAGEAIDRAIRSLK